MSSEATAARGEKNSLLGSSHDLKEENEEEVTQGKYRDKV